LRLAWDSPANASFRFFSVFISIDIFPPDFLIIKFYDYIKDLPIYQDYYPKKTPADINIDESHHSIIAENVK